MRILIAPDSYKGSLTAIEVAEAMERGFVRVFSDAQVTKVPIADGGEGTVEALVYATGGKIFRTMVADPLGQPIESFWGALGDRETAVIEMAAASGLTLVPQNKRNPGLTSSFGTGQLIIEAINHGYRKIILGLGGSATNDGGSGMARALGVRFLDGYGASLPEGCLALKNLARIDLTGIDSRVGSTEIIVACDVDNPLCGPLGASAIFGPQKGATPEMVRELDGSLRTFSEVASRVMGRNVADIPGSGAAGGMGAGLLLFTEAVLMSGIQIVIEATGLDSLIERTDLVVTGEGMTDRQTSFGKAPAGIGALAKKHGKVAICLSGSLGEGAEDILEHGVQAIASITAGPMTLEQCLSQAAPLIEKAAIRFALTLRAGMNLSKIPQDF